MPEIRFDDVPLEQVIDRLAELTGTNVVARWRQLEPSGIKRDTPITLHVRNLRFGQVMWLIMNQPPLADTKLAYRAESNIILLSTAADLGEEMIVRVYDVQELLQSRLTNPSFIALRQHEIVESVVPVVGNGAVAVQPQTRDWGSGVGIEGDDPGGYTNDRRNGGDRDDVKEQRIRELVNVITASLEPDSWAVNGGRCTIVPWRGHLVVRATLDIHQALGGAVTGD
ncbi:MAG: hypothetical protein HZB38_18825 [Planctomycetes bacterium]|nr:hypothetical protein [Planctomycetota bacterium]